MPSDSGDSIYTEDEILDMHSFEDRCVAPQIPYRPMPPWPKHGLDGRYKETKEYLRAARKRHEQAQRDLEEFRRKHKEYLECLDREFARERERWNKWLEKLPKQLQG